MDKILIADKSGTVTGSVVRGPVTVGFSTQEADYWVYAIDDEEEDE
jgi:hypothetical protein